MTKENLEIYQEVFPKSQLRRMKVVDEYLNTFGEMIKKKVISPNCAFEALAKKYELTRAGIRVMLTKAGKAPMKRKATTRKKVIMVV